MAPLIIDSSYIIQKNWLAIVQDDGIFIVRDIDSNQLVFTYALENATITCCTFSNQDISILLGSTSGEIIIIDSSKWRVLGKISGSLSEITKCELSPKGDYLAIVVQSKKLVIWDINKRITLLSKRGSTNIDSVVFAPYGDRLFVGFQDGIINVYSLYPIKLQIKLFHFDKFQSMEISPDGNYLALSFNNKIEIFSIKQFKEKKYSISDERAILYTSLERSSKPPLICLKDNIIFSLNAGGLISCCFGKSYEEVFYCNIYGQIGKIELSNNRKVRKILFSSDDITNFNEIYYSKNEMVISLFKDGKVLKLTAEKEQGSLYPILSLPDITNRIPKNNVNPNLFLHSLEKKSIEYQTPDNKLPIGFFNSNPGTLPSISSSKKLENQIFFKKKLIPKGIIQNNADLPLPHGTICIGTIPTLHEQIFIDDIILFTNKSKITPKTTPLSLISNSSSKELIGTAYQISVKNIGLLSSYPRLNDSFHVNKPTNQIFPDNLLICGIKAIEFFQNNSEHLINKLVPKKFTLTGIDLSTLVLEYNNTANIINNGLLPEGIWCSDAKNLCLSSCKVIPNFYHSLIGTALDNIYHTIPRNSLPATPIPNSSLMFDEIYGVHITIKGTSGFNDNNSYAFVLSLSNEILLEKMIYPDFNGAIDELIFELDKPSIEYNVKFCKNNKEYANTDILCFEKGLEGYLIFSSDGNKLSTDILPPEEIIIVIHQSNSVQITGVTYFCANTPNWNDYDYYIIPFSENNSIRIITRDNVSIELNYSLNNEPILIGGDEIVGLPLISEIKFYRKWPSLLIPLNNNMFQNLNIEINLHLLNKGKPETITISKSVDPRDNHVITQKMGYYRVDIQDFPDLINYSAAKVSISLHGLNRDFSFNLVQDLSITFQPENNPFLYVNDNDIQIKVNIVGPTHVSSGMKNPNCLIFSQIRDNSKVFLYSEEFAVKKLVNSNNIPLIVTYQLPNNYDAQFSLLLEIPIISFKLKSKDPLPVNLLPQYQKIERLSINQICFPVEYLYHNNFYCNAEINLPSYRKGSCSLIVSIPNLNINGEKIVRDEVYKKRTQSCTMDFSFREVYDAIHQEVMFPVHIQLRYRERVLGTTREQVMDLFKIDNYEISGFNYDIINEKMQWKLQLEWREKNRLIDNTSIIFQNNNYKVKGIRGHSGLCFNISIKIDGNNGTTSPIKFVCANRLNRSFQILISDDRERVAQNLWEMGCWISVSNIIGTNIFFQNTFFIAQHYHLILYSLSSQEFTQYEPGFNNLINSLVSNQNHDLFTYGIFYKILKKENITPYQLDLQKRIFKTKNIQLLKKILNLIYAYNHEFTKAKVGFVNKIESNGFLSDLYDSYCLEILGKNLFAGTHFFSLAYDLLKRACINHPVFIPFWDHLYRTGENLENTSEEISSLCLYMKNKISEGNSPISKEEIDKIKRALQ